jgi:hypothetical protein
MVVIERHQEQCFGARRFVRALGASERTLRESERANPGVDWLRVLHALDRVFVSHGGSMGQATFLRQRQVTLSGQTPLETLTRSGGPEQVCRAARIYASTR